MIVTEVGTFLRTILIVLLARLLGDARGGRVYGGASASAWRQNRRIIEIQYAVYPFRPRSDNGRSGVPGAIGLERVAGCWVR